MNNTIDKIKVLVVDDSFFMRQAITKILNSSDIEVIDTARNGKEAVEKALLLKPDIITMDIEMPVLNGLEALSEIMKTYPMPVLMVSTLTTEGADATIEALTIGAVDFIAKRPAFRDMDSLKDELVSKVKTIAGSSGLKKELIRKRLLRTMARQQKIDEPDKIDITQIKIHHAEPSEEYYVTGRRRPLPSCVNIIGIGISTGGPSALQELFTRLPGELPVPIVVAQHMPPAFTDSLAKRINGISRLNISEAKHGDLLVPGGGYIAPGGKHMTVSKKMRAEITDEAKRELFRPSADLLFNSIAESIGSSSIGIIMTGMGSDGTKGLKKLNAFGGYIIAQDYESCVVSGMPRSVVEAGIADEVVALADLPEAISSIFGLHAQEPLKVRR